MIKTIECLRLLWNGKVQKLQGCWIYYGTITKYLIDIVSYLLYFCSHSFLERLNSK